MAHVSRTDITDRPAPSAGLKAFSVLTIALLVGAPLAAVVSQFVPSRLALSLGFAAALGSGAAGAYFAAHPVKKVAGPRWGRSPAVRILILGLLYFAFGWMAIVQGAFAIYTQLVGAQAQQEQTVSAWRGARRFRCAGPDFVGTYQSTTICVDDGKEAEFPPGSVALLKGRASSLGINVESVTEGKGPV